MSCSILHSAYPYLTKKTSLRITNVGGNVVNVSCWIACLPSCLGVPDLPDGGPPEPGESGFGTSNNQQSMFLKSMHEECQLESIPSLNVRCC